ncbi:MAG: sigma-70 family RNA polymerase sigma factor [Clostridia bacterium]|nr:sigma-70 family RNA polymerase sigma factor [Clostridia bacterium]
MQKKDVDAFLTSYLEKIFKYCFVSLLFDRHLAEEAVNEVCVIVLKKKDNLNGKHIDAYLYRVADNVIKRLRSEKEERRRREVPLESYYSSVEKLSTTDNYFESRYDDEKYAEKIYQELPDDLKEIFRLRFAESMALKEIAARTGIPYSTVRLRIEKIKKYISQHEFDLV